MHNMKHPLNEPLKERVEAKAKELHDTYWDDAWIRQYSDISLQNKIRWLRLAKAVMISELMASINELELQSNRIGLCADDAMERINELTAELSELEKI